MHASDWQPGRPCWILQQDDCIRLDRIDSVVTDSLGHIFLVADGRIHPAEQCCPDPDQALERLKAKLEAERTCLEDRLQVIEGLLEDLTCRTGA